MRTHVHRTTSRPFNYPLLRHRTTGVIRLFAILTGCLLCSAILQLQIQKETMEKKIKKESTC